MSSPKNLEVVEDFVDAPESISQRANYTFETSPPPSISLDDGEYVWIELPLQSRTNCVFFSSLKNECRGDSLPPVGLFSSLLTDLFSRLRNRTTLTLHGPQRHIERPNFKRRMSMYSRPLSSGGIRASILALTTSALGAGIFTMPYAFSQTGTL